MENKIGIYYIVFGNLKPLVVRILSRAWGFELLGDFVWAIGKSHRNWQIQVYFSMNSI